MNTRAHPERWQTVAPLSRLTLRFSGPISGCFGRSSELQIPIRGCSVRYLKARLALIATDGRAALATPGLQVAVDDIPATDDTWVRPTQIVTFAGLPSE